MRLSADFNYEQLAESYENREAIYVEKGALRVRVSHIHIDTCKEAIQAEVEEIFSPGLGAGLFCRPVWNEGTPMRWKIGGDLTACYADIWHMGYGGWALYFAPQVVEGITGLATQWPLDLAPYERYTQVVKWLTDYDDKYPQSKRLVEA